eukprot:RCo036879
MHGPKSVFLTAKSHALRGFLQCHFRTVEGECVNLFLRPLPLPSVVLISFIHTVLTVDILGGTVFLYFLCQLREEPHNLFILLYFFLSCLSFFCSSFFFGNFGAGAVETWDLSSRS